jgi:hypothetical protein
MKSIPTKLNAAFGIFLFAAAVCYGVIYNSCHTPRTLTWDETDYAKAAQAGIAANAHEQNTVSIAEFIRLGYSKLKKQKQNSHTYPSEFIDPFHLRHFHPPLPVYFWTLFLNHDIKRQDKLLRLSNQILQVLSAILIFLFLINYLSAAGIQNSVLIAAASASFFVTSDIFLHAFYEINFHSFFLVAAVIFVYFLQRYLIFSSPVNSMLLGISSAVIVCTLETSPFIFAGAALAVFLFRQKKNLMAQWKILLVSFIGACFVLWPGMIFTLGPVKSWAMYVYRVFAMSNESYESISLFSTLFVLLKSNYLLALFLAAGYLNLFFMHRAGSSFNKLRLIPAVVGLLYGILMLPFTLNHTYLYTAAGLLFLGSLPGLINLLKVPSLRNGFVFFSLILLAVVFLRTDFLQIRHEADSREQNFNSDLSEVKSIVSRQKMILADGGRIFSYYLPEHKEYIAELFRFSDRKSQFAIRKNYSYVMQDNELKNNFYSAVFVGKTRNYSQEQFEQLKKWGYKLKELNNYYLFYL